MNNLTNTFLNFPSYRIQQNFLPRILFSSFATISFVTLLRAQISEIKLLQLVPGAYLFLLFVALIVLNVVDFFLLKLLTLIEIRKKVGKKSINKLDLISSLKLGFFCFSFVLLSGLNSVVPIALDSFNSNTEISIEHAWSFFQVLQLETIVLFLLLTISQIPPFFLDYFQTEIETLILPQYWQAISAFSFVLAAFLTPTIDGYTQVTFAAFIIALYLIMIFVLEKRIDIISFSSLG